MIKHSPKRRTETENRVAVVAVLAEPHTSGSVRIQTFKFALLKEYFEGSLMYSVLQLTCRQVGQSAKGQVLCSDFASLFVCHVKEIVFDV